MPRSTRAGVGAVLLILGAIAEFLVTFGVAVGSLQLLPFGIGLAFVGLVFFLVP
jgi:hypothetical protein